MRSMEPLVSFCTSSSARLTKLTKNVATDATIVGIVDTVSAEFEILQLVMKKKGLRVLQLSAPLADFRDFLHDPEELEALDARPYVTTLLPYATIEGVVRIIASAAAGSLIEF